jgi:predicted P-loop ATPase
MAKRQPTPKPLIETTDKAAELALLGCLLFDAEYTLEACKAAGVGVNSFAAADHRRLYTILTDAHDRGEASDHATVGFAAPELRVLALDAQTAAVSPLNAARYAARVAEMAEIRRMGDIATRLAQAAADGDLDKAADVLAEAEAPAVEKVSERIYRDLQRWGFDLWLNDLDDSVWNGADLLTDTDRSALRMRARDEGYARLRLLTALDDAILARAAQRRRHPVRDYLTGLSWDGIDHLARFATYFDDKHAPLTRDDGRQETVFHAFMRRWLIGAVAKMMGDADACRANFILVLAGAQNAGKSHLARWLCPLPGYFVEQHIAPDDKDIRLRRCNAWVWEISEIGATTRRADVESLKAFVTGTTSKERKAYGHLDTVKPAVASYIGTVNEDGAGFLTDRTGNRRFAVVDLEHINWAYAERIDITQLWAQAFHLWQQHPKGYRFTAAEATVQAANAEEHMAPDILSDMLVRVFEIDPTQQEWRETSSSILEKLRTFAGLSRSNDAVLGKEIARTLKQQWGITGKRSNGATVYTGLQPLPKYQGTV